MYYKIKEQLSQGFSKSQISRNLGIHRKTIYVYLSMSESEFLRWSSQVHKKPQKLARYEKLILGWLRKHNDLSSYQVHDWLLEHVPELKVSRRSVSSYVGSIRQTYHIPKPVIGERYYEQVAELPFGKQAQVDFGEYKMFLEDGSYQKVHFFGMVLSRSRYKFFYFQLSSFTAADAVKAHEAAFAYYDGIPAQLVYDQDKVLLVDEKGGDLVLTAAFQAYVTQRGFHPYFCRKADPQSKGKVENIIKYAKSNFLKNRKFIGIDLLNTQALAWLERTGNARLHGSTRKIPAQEFTAEQACLAAFYPLAPPEAPVKAYSVRKDNTISCKGNFYSLPLGTYKGQGTKVWVSIEEGELSIFDQERKPIAQHTFSLDKGKLIAKTQHKRNTSQKIDQLIEETSAQFSDPAQAERYFSQLREHKGRYIRDQLQMIATYCLGKPAHRIDNTLLFCLENRIFSARDFGEILTQSAAKEPPLASPEPDLLHKDIDRSIYNQRPQKSDIEAYEHIINHF